MNGGTLFAAKNMFEFLVQKVFHADISFFDKTNKMEIL